MLWIFPVGVTYLIRKLSAIFVVFLLIILTTSCNQQKDITQETSVENVELLISAAISLTDALNEMKEVFEKEQTGITLTYNLGGSGKLAQQIEQGAPADVFLSADTKWMDELESKSLIVADTRIDFTGNKIVLISNKDKDLGITTFNDIDATKFTHIAIGEPMSVPAGKYAKEALTTIGKWNNIEPKLVLAQDVRQVLTYVESRNADIGFVYSSDAATSEKISVVAEADAKWHSPIIYPAAVTADSKNQAEAKQFVEFLQSEQGQMILAKYGFIK